MVAARVEEKTLRFRLGSLLALVGAALLVSACATRGGKIPYDVADFGAPDAPGEQADPYVWGIGPLDVVDVKFFQVPDLSGEYQVSSGGVLDLPLVGAVEARYQQPDQFARALEQLYGQRYLNSPQITVRIVKTSQRNLTVEGGVKNAGIYPLEGRTTLLGAIALAKGIDTQEGNPRRVAIFRKRNGQTVAAAFDVIAIRRGEMADPLVYPGDTVVVDSNSLRSAYRELLQLLPIAAVFGPL